MMTKPLTTMGKSGSHSRNTKMNQSMQMNRMPRMASMDESKH